MSNFDWVIEVARRPAVPVSKPLTINRGLVVKVGQKKRDFDDFLWACEAEEYSRLNA